MTLRELEDLLDLEDNRYRCDWIADACAVIGGLVVVIGATVAAWVLW